MKTWLITKRKRFPWQLNPGKGKNYTRFVILCAPRSGSTLLHTYLNSHDAILSHGEIIRRKIKRGEKLLTVKEFVFKPQTKQIKAVGLKLFYEYQNLEGFKKIFNEVLQDRSIKIIHLIREDKRQQLISLRKAEKSGVWSVTLKNEKDVKVEISEKEFSTFEEKQYKQIEQARKLFNEHEITEITYEELVNNPKDVLNCIQQFIHVVPKKLFTLLKKQGEG